MKIIEGIAIKPLVHSSHPDFRFFIVTVRVPHLLEVNK
jgi:hypothetical protein